MTGFVGAVIDTASHAVDVTLKTVENTVQSIARDPIGTLLPAAVSVISGGTIPPYVTAAAITASRGGNIGQIATTALVSYGAQNLAGTKVGDTTLGDLTTNIAKDIGGSAAVQAAVTSGLNNAAFNGLLAIAQGKNVGQAIGSGLVGGALGSGVNTISGDALSYFKSAEGGTWGFSGDQLKLVQGGINTALVAGVSGQDVGKALNAYVARAAQSSAAGKLSQFVETNVKAANEAIKNYNTEKGQFESAVDAANAQQVLVNNTLGGMKVGDRSALDIFKDIETERTTFEDYKTKAEAARDAGDIDSANKYATLANEAATKYNDHFNQIKDILPTINPEIEKYNTLAKAAETEYEQTKAADPTKAIESATGAQTKFDTALAEAGTRDFLIEQINNGSFVPVGYEERTGRLDFGNGLTFDGTNFYQNGKKTFTNAADFEMDKVGSEFTAKDATLDLATELHSKGFNLSADDLKGMIPGYDALSYEGKRAVNESILNTLGDSRAASDFNAAVRAGITEANNQTQIAATPETPAQPDLEPASDVVIPGEDGSTITVNPNTGDTTTTPAPITTLPPADDVSLYSYMDSDGSTVIIDSNGKIISRTGGTGIFPEENPPAEPPPVEPPPVEPELPEPPPLEPATPIVIPGDDGSTITIDPKTGETTTEPPPEVTEPPPEVVKPPPDTGPIIDPGPSPELPVEPEMPEPPAPEPPAPVVIPGDDGGTITVDPRTGETTTEPPPEVTEPPGPVVPTPGDPTDPTTPIEPVMPEPPAPEPPSPVVIPGDNGGVVTVDPATGGTTTTYTADDGSTLTIDENGDVVDVTDATDTGPITEPPGPTPPTPPVVTPPKPPVTPPVTPTTPATPSTTPDMASLLALIGGQQAAAPAVQDPYAHIKSFEDLFGDIFGPAVQFGPSGKTTQAATGGSINDLLRLLKD